MQRGIVRGLAMELLCARSLWPEFVAPKTLILRHATATMYGATKHPSIATLGRMNNRVPARTTALCGGRPIATGTQQPPRPD